MSGDWLIDFGKVSALTKAKLRQLLKSLQENTTLVFFAKHGRTLHVNICGNTFYLTYNKLIVHKRDLESAAEDIWEWIKEVKPSEWELVKNP